MVSKKISIRVTRPRDMYIAHRVKAIWMSLDYILRYITFTITSSAILFILMFSIVGLPIAAISIAIAILYGDMTSCPRIEKKVRKKRRDLIKETWKGKTQ